MFTFSVSDVLIVVAHLDFGTTGTAVTAPSLYGGDRITGSEYLFEKVVGPVKHSGDEMRNHWA